MLLMPQATLIHVKRWKVASVPFKQCCVFAKGHKWARSCKVDSRLNRLQREELCWVMVMRWMLITALGGRGVRNILLPNEAHLLSREAERKLCHDSPARGMTPQFWSHFTRDVCFAAVA